MSIATPSFFWFPKAWNMFYHIPSLSVYMCPSVWSGSPICIHSLFLFPFSQSIHLLGAFNPLTFDIIIDMYVPQFNSVQSLSRVWLFMTPGTAACQASMSINNSQSLLKLMSIESMRTSNHLILCCPLLLLPSIFPSIRIFSNESALLIRWPKHQFFQWIFKTDLL